MARRRAQQNVTVDPSLISSTTDILFTATTLTLNGAGFDTKKANDSVTFSNGVTGTVSAATATQLTIGSLSGLTLGALYASVTVDGLSSGAAVQVATVQDGTSTKVTAAPSPANYGTSVTFTATISATDAAAGIPGGTVSFKEGGTTLAANVPVNGSGVASCSTSSLSVGSDTITASFTGTSDWINSSGSATAMIQDGTNVSVTPSPSPAQFGDSVTFTAAISSADAGAGVPSGTVTFTEGTTTLAANVPVNGNGDASFSTSSLALGSNTITASFTGTNGWLNNSGNGTETVDKALLTVTAYNQTRLYGQADPTFTYVISGLPAGQTLASLGVTGAPTLFSSDTVASPVGAYTITVGAGTLAAAGYGFTTVNGTLTVNKAHLTVTANAASRLYGAADPTFSATYTGFVNSDTASVVNGHPTFTSTDTATSPVGPYTITPILGTLWASNYNFTVFNTGTLTVNKAHLTVSANSASRVYGAADPALTYTLTGFVNGDTASVVGGKASISSNDTVTSPVGTYTITPVLGTLTASNYDFTVFNTATLTVGKADLSVSAVAASRAYGAADPSFAVTIAGFVNGQTASVVSGQASITSNDTVTSPVGSYTITPSLGTLSATNYAFTVFSTATLTVTKASLTVTANAASRLYGAAGPGLHGHDHWLRQRRYGQRRQRPGCHNQQRYRDQPGRLLHHHPDPGNIVGRKLRVHGLQDSRAYCEQGQLDRDGQSRQPGLRRGGSGFHHCYHGLPERRHGQRR